MSEKTRKKISKALTGRKLSPEHKAKVIKNLVVGVRKGAKVSDKTRKRMSKAQSGRNVSEETKRKIRIQKNSIKGKRTLSKAGKLGALKRWEGHIAKPRQFPKGMWTGIHDKSIQLQKKRFRNQRYKAKKRTNGGSHTFEEWIMLKTYYGNMCLCCKRCEPEIKLTEDHIIPLFKGGSDNIENIQPLCQSCNTRKRISVIDFRSLNFTEGGESLQFSKYKIWQQK